MGSLCKYFIRGYFAERQDISLDTKKSVIDNCEILLGRNNESRLKQYLKTLKEYRLDFFTEGFVKDVSSIDERIGSDIRKLFEDLNNEIGDVCVDEKSGIDGEALNRYLSYPTIDEIPNIQDAIKMSTEIWKKVLLHKWGSNTYVDGIVSIYLLSCVEHLKHQLENTYYDYGYKSFLIKDDKGRFDHKNTDIIYRILSGDEGVQGDGLDEFDSALKENSSLGLSIMSIISDKNAWHSLYTFLRKEELEEMLFQGMIFSYHAVDAEAFSRFVVNHHSLLRLDRIYMGRCIVQASYKVSEPVLASALMSWFVSDVNIKDAKVRELKKDAGDLIRTWLLKLDSKSEKSEFMKNKYGDKGFVELAVEHSFSDVKDVIDYSGKYSHIEDFMTDDSNRLEQLCDSYLLYQYENILDNLIHFFKDGSRGTTFEKEYVSVECRQGKELLQRIKEMENDEDDVIMYPVTSKLRERHLEHIENLFTERLKEEIEAINKQYETIREEYSSKIAEFESYKSYAEREKEQTEEDYRLKIAELEEYYKEKNNEIIKEYEERTAQLIEDAKKQAITGHYDAVKSTVDSNVSTFEDAIKSILGITGTLITKLDDSGDMLSRKLKEQLYTSELTHQLLLNANDPKVDYTISIMPLTKAIEITLKKLFEKIEYVDLDKNTYSTDKYNKSNKDHYINKKKKVSKIEMGGLVHLFSTENIVDSWSEWWNKDNKYVDIQLLRKFNQTGIFLPQRGVKGMAEFTDNNDEKNREILFKALDYIRDKYRNPIAHTTNLVKQDYYDCKDILVSGQKLFWILLAIIK